MYTFFFILSLQNYEQYLELPGRLVGQTISRRPDLVLFDPSNQSLNLYQNSGSVEQILFKPQNSKAKFVFQSSEKFSLCTDVLQFRFFDFRSDFSAPRTEMDLLIHCKDKSFVFLSNKSGSQQFFGLQYQKLVEDSPFVAVFMNKWHFLKPQESLFVRDLTTDWKKVEMEFKVEKIAANLENQTQLLATKDGRGYLVTLNEFGVVKSEEILADALDLKYMDYYQNATMMPMLLYKNRLQINELEIQIEATDSFYVTDIHFNRQPSIFLRHQKETQNGQVNEFVEYQFKNGRLNRTESLSCNQIYVFDVNDQGKKTIFCLSTNSTQLFAVQTPNYYVKLQNEFQIPTKFQITVEDFHGNPKSLCQTMNNPNDLNLGCTISISDKPLHLQLVEIGEFQYKGGVVPNSHVIFLQGFFEIQLQVNQMSEIVTAAIAMVCTALFLMVFGINACKENREDRVEQNRLKTQLL